MDALERLQPALAVLRAHSEEADRTGELPRAAMDAMFAAGGLRWSLPRSLGGDECTWTEKVAIAEAVGRADLCTGWIFWNYDSHAWDLAGRTLEPFPGAFDLLKAETPFCGTVAAVQGSSYDGADVLVSGRFNFMTGWRDARWMRSNVVLPGPDPLQPGSSARFHLRLVHLPLDAPGIRVERTWDALGLRGSLTDTLVLDGVRVPAARALPVSVDATRRAPDFDAPSPHYRGPGWAMANARIGASLAGCGWELFDRALEYVGGQRSNLTGQLPSRFPAVRLGMAEAYIALEAAVAAQRGMAAQIDARAAAGEGHTPEDELMCWATGTASTRSVLHAVDELTQAIGATGTQRSFPFERHMRDIRTGALHLGIHPNLVKDRVTKHLFGE